jgi:hypothetical protein
MLKVSYQNAGSGWLVILTGKAEEINLAFNSFWNHGATNGELDWISDTTAQFWTSAYKLKKYFVNRAKFILTAEDSRIWQAIKNKARMTRAQKVNRIFEIADKVGSEQFDNFKANFKTDFKVNKVKFGGFAETFSLASDKAEKPDESLKDMFISNGLKAREA